VDVSTGEALAAEARAVRREVLALADELRRGACSPRPDVYGWVETLIHHEAIAVADTTWPLDD
jgi:hypothetical protein